MVKERSCNVGVVMFLKNLGRLEFARFLGDEAQTLAISTAEFCCHHLTGETKT